ncbi:MAG: response regulator [Elusimicrobiota bacterium]|nr:response regulator [Elusimicrobiota bacterium]MDH5661406.1 response regulator [Elusimicrobiota bacterium]
MAKMVNLLIVDDDISILETIGDVFQDKGYNVAMVENGQRAIRLVKRRYFDVVLMDIRMPGIDGLETYKEVKRIIPTAAVIMMTGDSKEELVKKAIEEGAYTIIYKPFNVKKVIKIVEEALKKPLILIVDDRIEDRETLRDILAEKGYRTVLAKDGYEAVGFSEKGNFDVILLDIKMPGINGIQTMERIKEFRPEAGIIMMTAYSMEEFVEESLRKGAYTCLFKPIDVEKMLEAIQKVRDLGKKFRREEQVEILVVDDDPNYRETVADILEDEGYKVSKVETGTASIEEVKKKFFNVALVDFGLADINGLELAKRIKAIDNNTYIILITGHASLETALKAIEMREEIYSYVVKGGGRDPGQLKWTIKSALREQVLTWDKMEAENKLKRANRRLEELSITDDLTGIYNRRHFYEKLSEMTARAKRYKLPLSLLMFDVDHFKSYNDTHGHLAGNRVLERVGRIVSEEIREVDWGFRYGGDEFTVILPETSKKDAIVVAERIRKSFEKCKFDETTLSIGIAQYDLKSDSDTLIRHADETMYKAKSQGGNKIEIYGT